VSLFRQIKQFEVVIAVQHASLPGFIDAGSALNLA
jgi:hypothetical protein